MPSFPTINGNYRHFFEFTRHYIDDLIGSRSLTLSKFLFYSSIITIYVLVLLAWRIIIDYGYYSHHQVQQSDAIHFLYNYFYMFFLSIFNFSVIVLLTSGMTRSQICYQLIIGSEIHGIKRFCKYMLFLVVSLIFLSSILMIPYLVMYYTAFDFSFHQYTSNCTILECSHFNLVYIINFYVVPCTVPSIAIIAWYSISLCICPNQLSISYNLPADDGSSAPPQQINHIVDFAKVFRDTITGSVIHSEHHSIRRTSNFQSRDSGGHSLRALSPFASLATHSQQHSGADYLLLPDEEHKFELNPSSDFPERLESQQSQQSQQSQCSVQSTAGGSAEFGSPSPEYHGHRAIHIKMSEIAEDHDTESELTASSIPSHSTASSQLARLLTPKSTGSLAALYAVVFTSCFAILVVVLKLTLDLRYTVMDKYVVDIFAMIRCILVVFQLALTRIGRKCDELIHRKDRLNCFISIEYLMEWYCTMAYYVVFRYLTAYHCSTTPHFLWLLGLHLLFEMPMSMKLLFDSYYDLTAEWIENELKLQSNAMSKWMYQMVRDNSSKEQWRNRCSMDIVLRIYASLLSTVIQMLIVVSGDKHDFHIVYLHGKEYHAVVGYVLIATACEFVHILCVYLGAKSDILCPFVNWISSMTLVHQFVYVTVSATVVVVLIT